MLTSAAFADSAKRDEAPATELDPLTVNPHYNDPLFKSDRKLKDLLDGMPCMGCDAKKPRPDGWKQIAKDIGKAMLQQVTPINPEVRESDPVPEAPDLSPDAVSQGKPSTDRGRLDPSLDGGVAPISHLP